MKYFGKDVDTGKIFCNNILSLVNTCKRLARICLKYLPLHNEQTTINYQMMYSNLNFSHILGVMKIKNLQNLFNKSAFQPEDLQTYICGLLEKFEVALQFDSNKLLIPSLLPTENEMEHVIKTNMDAKVFIYIKNLQH